MENKTLTIEQALNNIQILIDNHVGKKAEHDALAQTMAVIKENLIKNP